MRQPLLLLGSILFAAFPLAAAAPPAPARPAGTPSPAAAPPPGQPRPELLAAFQRANERFVAGDYAGVVALLAPLAKAADAPPPMRTLLAAAYLGLGRAAEAAAVVAPLAESEQAGPALLFQAAQAAAALGDEAKAETYLRRAAVKDPTSLAARTLGMRRGGEGKLAEACGLLQPYAAAHADDTDARLSAAFCSLDLGQAATASALLEGLPADEPRARLLRARVALQQGHPDEAIAQLSPLAANPPAVVAHDLRRNLAEAYLEVGKADEAAKLLAGKTAGDVNLSLLLARAKQQGGDPAGVVTVVAPFAGQLTAPAPPAADRQVLAAMALEWGRALVTLQRWGEAVTALQAATRLDAASAPAWQALVQALRGAGRSAEAEQALARFREASAAKP
ncbi:MAG TPA: tetratricopeptide repeat protein [Thermoanaerobaculia bacterium]|jgi:predicted Zn-dependent protease|nr:tetratricopeptide repeat protein [Thermoanaerobaculia bacterium]